jgi:hypothetical protein
MGGCARIHALFGCAKLYNLLYNLWSLARSNCEKVENFRVKSPERKF